jgi:hypothetical protein
MKGSANHDAFHPVLLLACLLGRGGDDRRGISEILVLINRPAAW